MQNKTLVSQNTLSPSRKVKMSNVGTFVAVVFAAMMSASNVPFLVKFISYPGIEAAMGGIFATIAAWAYREYA